MADGIASNVAVTMLEPIRDSLYAVISRHFGYMIHCKKNIQDFADAVDNLKNAHERVQTRVDEATDNAEIIYENVLKWLTEVGSLLPKLEQDKNTLLQGKQNLKCFAVCSRYRLGKKGKRETPDVTKLIEAAGNFDPVGHRPPLTGIWHRSYSTSYESFLSRELVFKEIMKALKDDGSYKIGIYGMPGVGKTRMMKEVAQQAEKEKLFDEIVEIVFTQNPNVKEIQQKLAEGLNLSLDKQTEDARKGLLLNRLKNGKKILVMVDDVWRNGIRLENIGIPSDDHTKGCKILLTSREQHVGKEMGVSESENFKVGFLSKDEAWSLFEKKVGDSIKPCDMHPIAEAVCEECACLPLALLAVGGALKNKSKQIWEDAIEQLRNSRANNILGVEAKLYSPIEFSYNYLQPKDAKSIFLLCCLFSEDAEISIHDLMSYGFGMRLLEGTDTLQKAWNRAHTMVDILKISSLLLEGGDEYFVKMHDVIRDVAISIASKEEDAMFLVKAGVTKWPDEDEYKQCKAISLRFNDDYVLPDDLECSGLHTLMLEFCSLSSEVSSSFFKGMEMLKVLRLRNMQISELPSSLKNLRMLRLYNCKLVNVAFLKEFKKLEILCIEDSDLEELAPEIGQLTHLRLLDVRCCENLKILPSGVISNLSQLEELYIPDEFDGWEVEGNASLMELNSLTRLISLQVHVPNVGLLPLKEIPFKLIRFKISIGSKFDFFDFFLSKNNLSSQETRILKLVGFPMKKELNILMEKAQVLYLEDLKENIPKGLCRSVSFSELSLLKIVKCKSMIYLFSSVIARSLWQLKELSISDCEIMEEIVTDDQEVMDEVIIFQHLKKIRLEDLPKLRSFYASVKKSTTRECNTSTLVQALFNDKVRFPALEELKIENLKSITAIWDNQLCPRSEGQDSFQLLRLVHVECSEKLVNVIPPNAIPMLHNLESLEIVSCDSVVSGVEMVAIEEGDDEILMFPQLKNLKLQNLSNLKRFCYSTSGSEEQEEECGGKILVFSQLRTMRLEDLPKLGSFCCSRRGGEELVVEESNIDQRKALFNHKVKFPCLEELFMKKLDNLEEIWHSTISTDSVSKLRKLKLEWCRKLLNVGSTELHTSFQNLEKVKVLQCESLQEVFKVEGSKGAEGTVVFPQLRTMRLEDLPKLSSFCCSTRGGEELVVEGSNIPQQQALFNNKVEFPILEKLVLGDGSNIFGGIWKNCNKVRFMEVKKYINVVNACTLLQWLSLEVVEELALQSCDSLEVIFNLEGLGAIERKAIVSSQAKTLRLGDLPKLERIWIMESQGLLVFHNLTSLNVRRCNSLRYVFSLSIARGLTQLRELVIGGCSVMEEIVRSEGQGEEDDMEEIVFSQLENLWLLYLPNLTCFCGTNNAFNFPSLKGVLLRECPKLQTFTSGGISSSGGITINFQDQRDVSYLNSYVQRRLVGKGKKSEDDDDDDDYDDDDDE